MDGDLQRVLAIPMALTVAALLWLLWRRTGRTSLNIGIAGSVLVGLLSWIGGRSRPLGVVALTSSEPVSAGAAYAMPFLFTLAPPHSGYRRRTVFGRPPDQCARPIRLFFSISRRIGA